MARKFIEHALAPVIYLPLVILNSLLPPHPLECILSYAPILILLCNTTRQPSTFLLEVAMDRMREMSWRVL
ncbi:uncharacterized protein BJ212DRAFT_1337221 [Suillus subaureus]|uniref:Uncharacterized protein n=1 Tax=Suillus subaureus TaxID=48587 RepID=A0A9P7JGL3_9AGAM|nr:uncharacterized protein BJ212DRAFT_1337221 [Suillus subaureus]KAG1821067.1 hypothetical protein BJ212DRAFT_1337221 [Suillus subaureus]